ncbi:YceI family protein [Helicobacter trogontum]|uniref:Lipid/polyisoprenoid-binding YceI-like domain-containing protein n=1 Tax=Helicobacter trogontum TaxID=50960 RepID=A0A4U8SFQ4_9HELI|nr:YceI family protein [Helicobacter trogontum]TLD84857.1 hypothetical protein LS81_000300 [Helicobacter trogontum]
MNKFFALYLLSCLFLYAKEYVIDETHSSVSFGVKHLSVADTIGHFQEFSGTLDIEDNRIKKLQGEVVIASINTYNAARDEELLTTDFFSTKKATLQSISFKNNLLRTKLTINNITKEVVFKVKITGPIRNPSLVLKEKSKNDNPFMPQATNTPLQNPHLKTNDSDTDCGCYISYGDNVIGVELYGSINRFDFDIAKTTPKELLGKDVNIRIILEASN